MTEFDNWGQEVLARGDLDALLNHQHKAPAARLAHPCTEHFAPLFATLGAAAGAQPADPGHQRFADPSVLHPPRSG
jgi:4,5-DOPA dioxygenase extradiol